MWTRVSSPMRKILAAVDESDTAKLVVERAVELARMSGAKLRLVRAVSLTSAAMPPPPGSFVPIPSETIVESAEASLKCLEEQVPVELRDGAVLELGSAADAVCRMARAYDADMVVIGAHRYGVLARVLGTTAARIVNRIERPVVVVRPVAADAAVVDEGAGPGDALRRDHARLDVVYHELLEAYGRDDWTYVRSRFDTFDAALRRHMEDEESDVLPAFSIAHPSEADDLRAEHVDLRRELDAFGVRVDLHAATLPEASRLIERMRAHAAREERLLYSWMNAELPRGAVHGLCPAA
jgi:nucleotide-binding universal stress UspA family protein